MKVYGILYISLIFFANITMRFNHETPYYRSKILLMPKSLFRAIKALEKFPSSFMMQLRIPLTNFNDLSILMASLKPSQSRRKQTQTFTWDPRFSREKNQTRNCYNERSDWSACEARPISFRLPNGLGIILEQNGGQNRREESVQLQF